MLLVVVFFFLVIENKLVTRRVCLPFVDYQSDWHEMEPTNWHSTQNHFDNIILSFFPSLLLIIGNPKPSTLTS